MRDWLDGFFTAIFGVAAVGLVLWFLNYMHIYGGGRLICIW